MKQLVPTSIEEYLAERQEGDVVSGRVMEISSGQARVELGEGIQGKCRITVEAAVVGVAEKEMQAGSKADLLSLSSILQARWKGGAAGGLSKPEAVRPGQIRSFRIGKLDPATKNIELGLA